MASKLEQLMPENLKRVFNEPDAQRREKAIEELWQPDCLLVDPQGRHEGLSGINEDVSALHQLFPDCSFVETSPVQEQFGVGRMTWLCHSQSKGDLFTGMDVCVERDGKLWSLFAFRDKK